MNPRTLKTAILSLKCKQMLFYKTEKVSLTVQLSVQHPLMRPFVLLSLNILCEFIKFVEQAFIVIIIVKPRSIYYTRDNLHKVVFNEKDCKVSVGMQFAVSRCNAVAPTASIPCRLYSHYFFQLRLVEMQLFWRCLYFLPFCQNE